MGEATFVAGYSDGKTVSTNDGNVEDGLGRLPAGTILTMDGIKFPNDVIFRTESDEDREVLGKFINSLYDTNDYNKNFNHSYQRAEMGIDETHYEILQGTNVANVLNQIVENGYNDFERQNRLRVALTLLPRTNVENVGEFVQNFDTIYQAYTNVQTRNGYSLEDFIERYRELNSEENVQDFGRSVSEITTSTTNDLINYYFKQNDHSGPNFGNIRYELPRVILRGCEIKSGVATFVAGYSDGEIVENVRNVEDVLGRLPAGTRLTMNKITFPNNITFSTERDLDKKILKRFIDSLYNTNDYNKNFNHSYQRAEMEIDERGISTYYKILQGTDVANVLSQVIKNVHNNFEKQDRLRVALTLLPETDINNVEKFMENFNTIYQAYTRVQTHNDKLLEIFINSYRELNCKEGVQNFEDRVSEIADNLLTPSTGQVQTTPQVKKQKVQVQQPTGSISRRVLKKRETGETSRFK